MTTENKKKNNDFIAIGGSGFEEMLKSQIKEVKIEKPEDLLSIILEPPRFSEDTPDSVKNVFKKLYEQDVSDLFTSLV